MSGSERPLGRILQFWPRSATGSAVCSAIRTLSVLEFDYKGLHRVVAPYVHGNSTRGLEVVRAVQLRGGSRSGALGSGKLWILSEIKDLRLTGERFVPDDPDYNPDDEAIARTHCRVVLEAEESPR